MTEHSDSLDAEVTGLELGIAAIMKFSRAEEDVNPHGAEVLIPMSEFLKDRLYLLDYPAEESEKQ